MCQSDVRGKGSDRGSTWRPREHHVNADPARLQQVFWNLIKNAVKFTPARRLDHDPHPQRGGPAEGRGTARHRGQRYRASASSRKSCPRSSTPSSRARRRSPASTAGWAWAWRSAGASSRPTAARSPPRARARAGDRRSGSGSRPCRGRPSKAMPSPSGDPEPGRLRRRSRVLVVEDEPATLRLMARLLGQPRI